MFSSSNNHIEFIDIVFGSLLIIGTFLQTTRDFLDISGLINRNKNTAIAYQAIVNDIEEQLSQERQDRTDGKTLLRKIKVMKNDIVRNGPSISSVSWKKLKNSIAKGDIIHLYNSDFFNNYLQNLDDLNYIPNNEYIHKFSSNTPTVEMMNRNSTKSIDNSSISNDTSTTAENIKFNINDTDEITENNLAQYQISKELCNINDRRNSFNNRSMMNIDNLSKNDLKKTKKIINSSKIINDSNKYKTRNLKRTYEMNELLDSNLTKNNSKKELINKTNNKEQIETNNEYIRDNIRNNIIGEKKDYTSVVMDNLDTDECVNDMIEENMNMLEIKANLFDKLNMFKQKQNDENDNLFKRLKTNSV